MRTIKFGIRDGALKRLLQSHPCTIRCEESLYNRLKEVLPIKWEKHIFIPGENPYQPGELYMHVYFHSTPTQRGEEFRLDLHMYFKEFQ